MNAFLKRGLLAATMGTAMGLGGAAVAAAPDAGLSTTLDDITSIQLHTELLSEAVVQDAKAKKKPKYSFTMKSDDGAYKLRVLGLMQFRYVSTQLDRAPGREEFTHGFENFRTRLGFKGTIVDPKLSYFMLFDWTRSGSTRLLDSWIGYDFGDGLKARVGQFRGPMLREFMMPSTRLTLVERSLVSTKFNQFYNQGIEGTYTTDKWRLFGAVTDGLRSHNDPGRGTQLGLTGRFEVKLFGDWKICDDFCHRRTDEPGLVIGTAIHYQDGGTGGTGIYKNDTQITQFHADVRYGFSGGSIFANYVYNMQERPGGTEFDQFGALIQGGIFVGKRTELTARYTFGDLDGEGALWASTRPGHTASEDLSVVTVGVAHYFAGHAVKFTGDVGFTLDELSGAWGGAGIGWSGDDAGAGTGVLFRAQMQVLF